MWTLYVSRFVTKLVSSYVLLGILQLPELKFLHLIANVIHFTVSLFSWVTPVPLFKKTNFLRFKCFQHKIHGSGDSAHSFSGKVIDLYYFLCSAIFFLLSSQLCERYMSHGLSPNLSPAAPLYDEFRSHEWLVWRFHCYNCNLVQQCVLDSILVKKHL